MTLTTAWTKAHEDPGGSRVAAILLHFWRDNTFLLTHDLLIAAIQNDSEGLAPNRKLMFDFAVGMDRLLHFRRTHSGMDAFEAEGLESDIVAQAAHFGLDPMELRA